MTKKAKATPQWLDRGLVLSPYYFTLCLTEKAFRKQMKHLLVPEKDYPSFVAHSKAGATIHFYETNNGKLCAIVCLSYDKREHCEEQIAAMLAHEAIHLWQAIREHLGEKNPSSEFEAYSVQSLVQALYGEFLRQTKPKGKKQK